MNIVRSKLVDQFKHYGGHWYYAAQNLPIDQYKDLLILYDFFAYVTKLPYTHLVAFISQRTIDYNHCIKQGGGSQNPFIDMVYRRKITQAIVDHFFQACLLDTQHYHYRDDDEAKVYIHGIASSIGLMIAQIIGSAPAGYQYIEALTEALWIIYMLGHIHEHIATHCYIPQSTLDLYGVTIHDLQKGVYTYYSSHPIQQLIQYYIERWRTLVSYAVGGLSFISSVAHPGIQQLVAYGELVEYRIRDRSYNVFHPLFRRLGLSTMWGYANLWIRILGGL